MQCSIHVDSYILYSASRTFGGSNTYMQHPCRSLCSRSFAIHAGHACHINVFLSTQGYIGNGISICRSTAFSSIQNTYTIVFFTLQNTFIVGCFANAAAPRFQHNITIVLRTNIVHSITATHSTHQNVGISTKINVATAGHTANEQIRAALLVHINATTSNSTKSIRFLGSTPNVGNNMVIFLTKGTIGCREY